MTRVNNTRSGVVSGTDVPLPPNCATATCHHREHQLSQRVGYSTGWAMPSPYMQHLINGRTHVGTLTSYRRWWQIWKPKSVSWQEDVPCYDSECEKDHKTSPLAETLLDLPQISVRRGGIRFETRSSV